MKKNRTYGLIDKIGLLKMIKMMRFTIIILFLSLSQTFAINSYSQQTKLSIDMRNARVEDVLDRIEKNSEFFFMYNKGMVDVERKIDIQVEEKNVNEVLNKIFANTAVSYSIKDRQILLINSRMAGTGNESIFQQQKTVSGKVTDSTGAPLPGVSVVVKGTTIGIITDTDGKYSLPNIPANATLQFSFVGMKNQEVAVADKTTINVSLDEETVGIEEVVAIGYGTQKKGTVTSSITSVKPEDFVQGSVNNPVQLLRGKVAGLAINSTSGDPNNSGIQIMLRGVSTLTGNQQPLVVIDGIAGGSLETISPDDIESIEVLKDGSAAAIYGTRGTNGVIIVTTKQGTSGKGQVTVDYHGYVTYESISNEVDVFNASDYKKIPETTSGFFQVVDKGANTNWFDEISRNPVNQIHNLSVKHGDSKSNYIASVDYRTQDGVMLGSNKDQLKLRLAVNHSAINDRLRLSFSVNNTLVNGRSVNSSNYFYSRLTNPTEPVKDELGNYTIFAEINNPVQELTEEKSDIKWNQVFANGKIVVEPIDNLNFSLIGAIQRQNNTSGSYANRLAVGGNTNKGELTRNSDLNEQRTLESMVDYSLQSGNHYITALAGYSYQDFTWEGFNLYNRNFPSDVFGYNRPDLGLALQDGLARMGGYKEMSKLIAFFGRVNYSFADKYMFSGSIRREGSTKFGENHQWGWFPAVSAGWRLKNESFLKNVSFLDDLKLRVGFGVTGTEPNQPYLSQLRFDYGSPVFDNGEWIYSVGPSLNANPNLKWETKHEYNIGLDFSVFKNRLSGSVDVYNRITKDLIYDYNVPVPPNLVSTIKANVGEVSNKGIEMVLNGRLISKKDFSWDVSLNGSYNTNEVKKLSNDLYKRDFLDVGHSGAPVQKTTHRVKEGEPVGNFYGWKSIGLNDTGTPWIIEGTYGNEDDRQILGNGIPKIFAGFSTSVMYKDFDFSIALRGAFKYQILNQYRMLWENFIRGQQYNFPTSILEKPYGSQGYVQTEPAYVSYYVENGDFLKIDNVTLGYNIPFKSLDVLKKARVYISGSNLLTITKYKGVDPEVGFNGLAPGMDPTNMYPTTRTITIGFKLGF